MDHVNQGRTGITTCGVSKPGLRADLLEMATLERAKDVASLSRIAACVTTCFKKGAVHDSVAEGLKGAFPEAILLRWGSHKNKKKYCTMQLCGTSVVYWI